MRELSLADKIKKFDVIYGGYLANKYPQTCRDRCVHATSCRLSELYKEI